MTTIMTTTITMMMTTTMTMIEEASESGYLEQVSQLSAGFVGEGVISGPHFLTEIIAELGIEKGYKV